MTVETTGTRPVPPETPRAALPSTRTRVWTLTEVRWAGAALALFTAGGIAQFAGAPTWLWWLLYLACYGTGGWEPALAGLRAARRGTLDVDLLMVVAALGAASIGQIFDGALLIVIFATSGALEAFATQRTADSVRSLLDLAPDRARRITAGGTEESVDTAALAVGDVIVVRPGERVSADGIVLDGASDVDQATITGEPLPVDRAAGDEVFAGTLNGAGSLRVRVDRPTTDSVVARIVDMVQRASETKAPTQLFIEKIEQRYSVGVVVGTLALFGVPLLFGDELRETLLRAMTFMIVASPCAIVLATMPPLLSAIANAGRHGVLVKSAIVMEQLGTTTRVAFDKTGTLTEGTPGVRVVRALSGDDAGVLAQAAAAEQYSEHPLGRAVLRAAHDSGIAVPPATGFRATAGFGVTAIVQGRTVRVARPAKDNPGAAGPVVSEMEEAGYTAVLVTVDDVPVGALGIADRLRPSSRSTVDAVRAVTDGEPVLLTGDNHRAARHLAAEAGIRDVRPELLPEDKAHAVREIERSGHRVLLIGDGVNDAPALASAHLGVAMGRGGSDVALESADAVVLHDDLGVVPAVIALSRKARRLVKQNLVIAGGVIAVLVAWDLFGTLPLPLGVAGHEGSTILVALNGLRMLRRKAWNPVNRHARP